VILFVGVAAAPALLGTLLRIALGLLALGLCAGFFAVLWLRRLRLGPGFLTALGLLDLGLRAKFLVALRLLNLRLPPGILSALRRLHLRLRALGVRRAGRWLLLLSWRLLCLGPALRLSCRCRCALRALNLVYLVHRRIPRLVAIMLLLQLRLLAALRVAAARIIALVGRWSRGRRHRMAVPAIPSTASLRPWRTPVIAPSWCGV